MAIKIIAQRRELKIGKNPGVKKFVMRPELYTKLSGEKVIREAALRSGVSEGVMQACWDAAGAVMKAWATEGHSVALPGLGTMRFSVRSKAVEPLEDVKTNLITSRRMVFTPSVSMKKELGNTSIQITCIDEDGTILKRVTSADSGEVEDPDAEGGDNANTGDNTNNGDGNENQGGTGTIDTGGSTTPPDPNDPNPDQDE